MQLEQESLDALKISGIPHYMHDGIIEYYSLGRPPGSFLSAVINNDLREACAHADDTNIDRLKHYIMWFYNHAPSGTWGYKYAVRDYANKMQEERNAESGSSCKTG